MWLLKTEVLHGMRLAHARGREATADERRDFEAHSQAVAAAPKNLTVAGGVAQIEIAGVLTEKPDFLAWLFGGANTTYESIRASLAAAEADPAIKQIVLSVSSPGGSVNGLFETLAALEATSKPMRVRASLAASAAYALSAAAGRIEAVGPASSFGSIGVAASIFVDPEVVDIASTEAPNKRPDVTTEEGKAIVREELDAIHELFADAIARGRAAATGSDDINVDFVNANFGRGGTLLAAEAKKRKMIDSYPKPAGRASRASASAGDGGANIVTETEEHRNMTKDQLKAAHPELYAALIEEGREAGKAEGVKLGAAEERDRVKAHLTLGEASGDMKTALEAVASGEGLTAAVQAKYLAANMNRKAVDARQADSDAAAAAADKAVGSGGSTSGAAADPADQVADIVCGPKKESK